MLGCLSKMGSAGMLGGPQPEEDLYKKDTDYGGTNSADSVVSRDDDH